MAKHQFTPGEPLRPAGESAVERTVATLSKTDLMPFVQAHSPFTLIVLAHPKCPCTRATLHELARLIPRLEGKVAVQIYFVIPAGKTEAFAEGDNLKIARSLPGAKITLVSAAEIIHKLGGGTSGQVLVFDRGARLRFQGGITAGRGHEGDNPGAESIRTLVQTGKTQLTSTPVFGCSLRDVQATSSSNAPVNPS